MTVPGWWNERRYGLFVHANIATVPSFAPIGESTDWYWSHLGSDALPGTSPHVSPLAEVLAYHRDRWAHVATYDEFLPFLTYHRFDPDEPVELALQAGMSHLVHVARHQDGFCWWDAPATTRRSTQSGPGFDVLAEIAASCRRNNMLFGTSYSLLDWSRFVTANRSTETSSATLSAQSYIDDVVAAQVLDLVERYGTSILHGVGTVRGDGALCVAEQGRLEELIEKACDIADAQGLELTFNDGWGHAKPIITTAASVPAEIELRPWEHRRPLGASVGYNRCERPEHLLTSGGLLDLLSEVVAKGGNLAIDVGTMFDGTIPDAHKVALGEVGKWVNDHGDVIHRSQPFDRWGDAQVRYVRVDEHVVALDLAAGAEVVFSELTPDRYEVTSIEADDGGSLHWEQHRGGVTVTRIDRSPADLAGVYRLDVRPAPEVIRLFDDVIDEVRHLQPLLDGAGPGQVIQLQEGTYQGPVVIPAGVTLCGVGWDRTSIVGTAGTAAVVVTLGAAARLEKIQVSHGAMEDDRAAVDRTADEIEAYPLVVLEGTDAIIHGCRCNGAIQMLADATQVVSVVGARIVGEGERLAVEHCTLKGVGFGVGILITGGSGHRIHRNEVVGHLFGVVLSGSSSTTVSENQLECRWAGVHLLNCDHIEVVANNIQHTMRAVDVTGGNNSIITGNRAADGDSGAVVQFGATDTAVIDNHVERCRLAVLAWDAPTTLIGPNSFVDLHEEVPVVNGPDVDAD